MSRKCIVCQKKDGQAAHFYGLPKNENVKALWLEWISDQTQTASTQPIPARALVCSDHFLAKDMMTRRLRPGAVPCLSTLSKTVAVNSSSTTWPSVSEPSPTDIDQTAPSTSMRCPISSFAASSVGSPSSTLLPMSVPSSHSEFDQSILSPSTSYPSSSTAASSVNLTSPSTSYPSASTAASSVNLTLPFVSVPSLIDQSLPLSSTNCSSTSTTTNSLYDKYSTVIEIEMSCSQPTDACCDNLINTNSVTEVNYDVNIDINNIAQLNLDETFNDKTSKKKTKPKKKCAAVGCLSDCEKYHCFPSVSNKNNLNDIIDVCLAWIQNSGNTEILKVPITQLHSKYVLCAAHFTRDQYNNSDCLRLKRNVKPTRFVCTPLSDSVMNEYLALQNLDFITTNLSAKKCAAQSCHLTGERFYSFPVVISANCINEENLARCGLWVRGCGNQFLASVPVNRLCNNYYVCSNHFDDSQYFNEDRKRIRPDAVPTIFTCDPLDDNHMNNFPMWDENILFTETGNDDVISNLQRKFEDIMTSLKWHTCPKCKTNFFRPKNSSSKCIHTKQICEKYYTASNNMDPGEAPDELKGLSHIEEQLIARVHPMVSVFKIKGHQLGYKGNIINFPQNVHEFAKTLPHNLSSLNSNITIRTRDDLNPADFNVNADKVRKALIWLKNNNKYYRDIEISEENLLELPENGNVFDKIPHVIDTDSESDTEDIMTDEDEEELYLIKESSMPMTGKPHEVDQIRTVLNWPEISSQCINEFKDPGYIVMAFPCLFPTGDADLADLRDYKITPLNYFQHLMRFHDERFSKHPRFRYFALNSYMRWTALSSGGVFVNKTAGLKNMTVEELKKALEDNPYLMKKIMFHSSNLRGTRPFWYNAGQELLAMVEQLGLPTIFFTLSAADFHWPDLFQFLCPERDVSTLTEQERRTLIQEYPAKVDAFFLYRGETFIHNILKEKFEVQDMWYRIEYQHRGSPHIHGVLWNKNAPKIDNLEKMNDEEKQKIVDYFDELISTKNPDKHCPPGNIHPSRVKISEVVDLKTDLAMLLNRVQRHTRCSENYCLRRNKKTRQLECRFKFPVQTRDWSTIEISEEKGIQLLTARNDERLNKYNSFMIQTWRANIDVSPVLSKRALINYLAKYITKAEKQSKDMNEVLNMLMGITDKDKMAKSVIQRLYIQSCSERDYSAQETCHLLMGLPLYSAGGRKFVTINFRVLDADNWVFIETETNRKGKSFIEKYIERHETYNNKSLWYMARCHVLPSGRRHPKNRDAIVLVYPRLKKNNENMENYYRQQVLLHLPWRNEDEFLEKYNSWQEVYTAFEADILDDSATRNVFETLQPDEVEYEEVNSNIEITTEEWMTLAAMGPSQTVEKVELGRRDIDINYDWHKAGRLYDKYGGISAIRDFITNQKATASNQFSAPEMPSVTFTEEQSTVLNLLQLQIQSINCKESAQTFKLPSSVIVQGKAGTGKSLLIHAMKSIIYDNFGENSYALLGPTGVSALNINGSTIHSKLGIHPKSKELIPLNGPNLHNFRDKFKDTKFVIVDEYSMIGCNLMHKLNQRLKEAMDREDNEFGGLFVYFFGDIQQLGPVGDSPVYSTNQQSEDYIGGRLLYHNIEGSIVLSQVKRQSNINFQRVLNNVSTGNVTEEDFKVLQRRFKTSVSKEEKESFKDAIHLFPQLSQVDSFNKTELINLKRPNSNDPVPIARIPAHHNCNSASTSDENEAGGLKSILYLAEGCKIMLRHNFWTERGLVNGAVGKVVHILYDEDSDPQQDPPAALVCQFDSYKGPYLNDDEKTVVIPAITNKWTNKKQQECTRTQFPISLCYSCTIHKSQGLSLKKVFINIGALKEMSPGLTYTALSRVTSLEGLLLEPFSKQQLFGLNKANYIARRLKWMEYLAERDISNALNSQE